MKTAFKLIIGGLIVTGVWSCKSFEGTTVSVTPNPLEVHGDSIKATAQVSVPANSGLKKDVTYVAQPEIGDYKDIPEIRVNSNKYPNAQKEGIDDAIQIQTVYVEDAMQGKHLEIEHKYINAKGKEKSLPDLDNLAECCITTSRLFLLNTEYLFSDVNFDSIEPIRMTAQVQFPLDVWRLDESQLDKEEIRSLGAILKDQNPTANNIRIHGYASPEGPYSRNKFLADKRSEVVKNYVQRELKAAGYREYAGQANFNMAATEEDWSGFEARVRNSNLSEQKKRDLINVATSTATPQQKEQMLMEVVGGDVHAEIENLLAPLRRTTISVEIPRQLKTVRQLDSIAALYTSGKLTDMDLMRLYSREEWLATAQRQYANTGDTRLLLAYNEAYPNDYRIYNDMAILKLVDDQKMAQVRSDAKVKVDGDELKVKTDNAKLKMEGDEVKLKTKDDEKMKIDGDEAKVETKNVTIKQEPGKLKIEDEANDLKIKVEDGDMKVKGDGFKYKYEGVSADQVALLYQQDYSAAFKDLEKALSMNQNDYIALSNIGAVTLTQRNYTDAENYLRMSLASNESNQAHYNLGLVYAMQGKYDMAMQEFNKAGNNPKYLYNRGLTKLLMKDFEGAKSDLRTFISTYPDEARAYYVMAIAGARTNDVNLVTTNINKACSMNSELCDKAEKDLEFKQYWDNQAFKTSIGD